MLRCSLAVSILLIAVGASSCGPDDPRGTRMSGTAGSFDAGWFFADGGVIPLGSPSPTEYDPSVALPHDNDDVPAPTIDVPVFPLPVSVGDAPADAGVEHEPSVTPGSEPPGAEPYPAEPVPASAEPEAQPPLGEPEATPATPPVEPEPNTPSPAPEPEPTTPPLVPEPEAEPNAAPAPTPTIPKPAPTPTVPIPAPTPTVPSPAPTPTIPAPIPTPTVPAPIPTPTIPVPAPTVTEPVPPPIPPRPEPVPVEPVVTPEPSAEPEPDIDPCQGAGQCTPSCDPGFAHPVDENGCKDNCSCVALSPVCETCDSDERCVYQSGVLLGIGAGYTCAEADSCDGPTDCGCVEEQGDCAFDTGLGVCSCDNSLLPNLPLR